MIVPQVPSLEAHTTISFEIVSAQLGRNLIDCARSILHRAAAALWISRGDECHIAKQSRLRWRLRGRTEASPSSTTCAARANRSSRRRQDVLVRRQQTIAGYAIRPLV